ncbi:MAG: hypothetical protein LBK71_10500 [Verrucomicrobiales bacterium]|jgi:Na+-transporting methylmalonyl-CoA/oxaloacetate decarboxylase gamma subunit|nr:hypothetical protein [Verrucomicrobiales bacterium]
MSALRVIGTVVVFVFLGLLGLFALLAKIISLIVRALFAPAVKPAPPPRRAAADRTTAEGEVIEVEVINIRDDEPPKC